jgi:hypothetical protein
MGGGGPSDGLVGPVAACGKGALSCQLQELLKNVSVNNSSVACMLKIVVFMKKHVPTLVLALQGQAEVSSG